MPRPDPNACSTTSTRSSARPSLATSGPVAILAGAGTGKTRVISRRTAYAIATERRAGGPGARRHVHGQGRGRDGRAAARRSGCPASRPGRSTPTRSASCATSGRAATTAQPLPELLDSKLPILGRLARQLPGPLPVHAGQGPRRRDRVGEAPPGRRREPTSAAAAAAGPRAADPGRPVRADLRRLRAGEGTRRAGSTSTTCWSARSTCSRATPRPRRPSAPASAGSASTSTRTRTRSSSGCSSCGWASRRDLCVVGDEDQTIYTFTGATSRFLTAFAERWPGARVVTLDRNYRSTPQVLELANRLLAAEGRTKRLDGDARRRPGAARSARHAVGGGRARGARRLDPRADRGRHRARRDRGARPDERPAGADRGGADPGRRRVPGPRPAVLRPAGGPRRRSSSLVAGRRSTSAGRAARGGDPRALGGRRWATRRRARRRGATRRASGRRALDTLLAIVEGLVAAATRTPMRRRSSRSSTRAPPTSARARPTA